MTPETAESEHNERIKHRCYGFAAVALWEIVMSIFQKNISSHFIH